MSLFEKRTIMITGGTGSFGNAVPNRFLSLEYIRNEIAMWEAKTVHGGVR
jgi:FlaA1/EpsC-like NDP-sugar epimerase